MIKKLLILLLIIVGTLFLFSFLKSSLSFQDFLYKQTLIPRKRIDSFFEEKKEIVIEGIDSEKENIKDVIKRKGKSIWNNIGESIFEDKESFEPDIDVEG